MWYDELGVISIGAECGGPRDGGLSEIKVRLWELLCEHCQSTYSPAIDHYALALRIDGELKQFGSEGIERIRRSKRDRSIGADIVIPESVWRGKTKHELYDYLARQVRGAIEQCVARLRKDKETVDESRLLAEVDAAIGEFLRAKR